MAEGINFNSESYDDDADSSIESDKKKKKKKKKASQGVAAAVVGDLVEGASPENKATGEPKKNLFEQMRGWLFEDDKAKEKSDQRTRSATSAGEVVTNFDLADAADIEALRTVESADEAAAIIRAREAGLTNVDQAELGQTNLSEFRTVLSGDELSYGEGIINLHAEALAEQTFEQSVENDLAMIETVESPDEDAAVDRASQVMASAGVASGASFNQRPNGPNQSHPNMPFPAAGGMGGPGNPNGPPPPPWHNPNTPWSGPTYNTLPNAKTGGVFANMLASRRAFELAHVAGRSKGRVEGLIAGAIIGGGIEHVRHKRRERKMERDVKKELGKRDYKIEKLENDHLFAAQKAEADNEALKNAMKRETANAAKKQMAAAVEVSRQRAVETEGLRSAVEAQVLTVARSERRAALEATKRAQEMAVQEKTKAAEVDRLNALVIQQEQMEADRLQNPENHLETSAWHTIEVDKAGHIAENSQLEYGHEYYRERSHEIAAKTPLDERAGAAAVASMMNGGTVASQVSAATPQSVPPRATQLSNDSASTDDDEASDNASTTSQVSAVVPWIIALVAIFVLIVLLS